MIKSRSSTPFHMLAITIPLDACKGCVDKGYKMYKEVKFTYIYLQNRVNDEFL